MKAPDGNAVLDNITGVSDGNIWYSPNFTMDRLGLWNYSIIAKDADGYTDSADGSFTVPDTGKPLISLYSPENNTNSTLPLITFSFTGIDNKNTSLSYRFYLDSKLASSGNFWNATPVSLTLPVDSRAHSWFVELFDESNNSNTSQTRFINSLTDLLVTNISFSNDKPLEDRVITVSATVGNAGINATDVNIFVKDENNRSIGSKKISLNAGTNYSFTLPWNLTGLVPGNHSAIVEITQYPYLDLNLSNNNASASIYIIKDIWTPSFSEVSLSPGNITEHTGAVKFTVYIKDNETSINSSSANLHYALNESWNTVPLIFAGGDKYEATLTVDWDANQGGNITFYARASDIKGNYNESAHQQEYIDIINDIPLITIISPKNFSAWGGTRLVEWSCNNDNEGPCYSSVYYWKPHPWAPAYPDPKYWQQGVWVKLSDTGENTSYLWNTAGINAKTKINITATDGTYNVSNVSGEFTVDNNNVTLSIENYYHSASLAFVANTTGFIHGRVNGIDSKVTSISINRTNYTLTGSPIGRIDSDYSFTSAIPITDTFAVTIDAEDEAGNPGRITGFFIIDDAPPVIESVSPDSSYTNATATLRVAASDNYGVSMVNATVPTPSGVKEITLKLNSTLYEGEFKVPDLAGNYSINISAVDIAGNTNRTSINFTVFQGPELSIRSEDIIFTPLTIVTGGIVNITANIHNTGGQNATGVNVTFYNNSKLINSVFIDVPANSTVPAPISWNTTGLAGNVTILAKIERSNGVYEVNYSNNSASSIYFVDAPDFVVSSENITFQPDASVYSGMTVKVFAKIINLRSVGADNVRVNFYAGSPEIKNLIGSDIVNIQNSATADIEWSTSGYLYNQMIYVRINPDNSSPELNISNNIASKNFYINRYVGEQIPETLTFLKLPLRNVTHSKIRGMASGDFNNDSKIDFAIGKKSN